MFVSLSRECWGRLEILFQVNVVQLNPFSLKLQGLAFMFAHLSVGFILPCT